MEGVSFEIVSVADITKSEKVVDAVERAYEGDINKEHPVIPASAIKGMVDRYSELFSEDEESALHVNPW